MAFTSSLRPNEMIINDETPESVYDTEVEGCGRGLMLEMRGPNDYEYGEYAAPFPQELYIDESEWEPRIKEMEQEKTLSSDLTRQAGLECKNQASTNYCTTSDTEVLTDRGWVFWPDYDGKSPLGTMNVSTGMMEYQSPIATQVLEYNGEVIHSHNRRCQYAVTPNHRMLVRKWNDKIKTLNSGFDFVEAEKTGWYFGLPNAPAGWTGTGLVEVSVTDDRCYEGNDFVRLLSMICADGYAGGTEKTKNWVSFCCFDPKRYEAAVGLAYRCGFKESPSRRGVFVRYDAAALANYVRSKCYTDSGLGAVNKCVPDIVKIATEDQIKIFLDWFGDRSHTRPDNLVYFSSSKRMIDDLQELNLKVGKRGTITIRPAKSVHFKLEGKPEHVSECKLGYSLTISKSGLLSIDKKAHLHSERYDGLVYCATVPNSTLITRRNGTVLISGNCWINSPVYIMEVCQVVSGQPVTILSPASGGARIKNFRNVGGWGREAVQWIHENGINTVQEWPANAIDRRYLTSANIAVAKTRRIVEFIELRPRDIKQLMSLLLRRIPVSGGFNWWRHQVSLIDPMWLDGRPALRPRNSWGMSWGDEGYGVLQGSKMLPDDAVACISVSSFLK